MHSATPARFAVDDAAPQKTAVLLIAHGSRRKEANQDLLEIAHRLREEGRYDVIEVGYLELAEPTIQEACRNCADRGATCVLMLPYFLSAGRHVTADLERFRADNAVRHPHVDFRMCPPLGLHPRMIDIVLDRLAEGLAAK